MIARAKQEYVQAIYHRCRGARRPEKRKILDEFCQVTGHHRKHAIRLLNGPAPGAARPRQRRPLTYSPAVIEALQCQRPPKQSHPGSPIEGQCDTVTGLLGVG